MLIESGGNTILNCNALRSCKGSWLLVAQRSCMATLLLHPCHSRQPDRGVGWCTEVANMPRATQKLASTVVGCRPAHLSPIARLTWWYLWHGSHSVPLSEAGQLLNPDAAAVQLGALLGSAFGNLQSNTAHVRPSSSMPPTSHLRPEPPHSAC